VKLTKLKVAVVGHTNTGKTSLLRTLTRDAAFGEVSNRPATTRHVEGTALLIDGKPLVELYDTPGLEDSIGLLEHLESLRRSRQTEWIKIIRQFLDSPPAQARFEQEAKVLRQVLSSDVAWYVIDARDRVLGKHRDELEILGRTAKPVVPVLNFVASAEAKTARWREHLARVNMHAVVEFDTVVVNETGEQHLFEKTRTLLDSFRPTLDAVIKDRIRLRANLVHASADLLADLLIDVASYLVIMPAEGEQAAAMEKLRQAVRQREQRCVHALLELHRFRPDDYTAQELPIVDGQWGLDLFSPESLKQFGIRAGSAAAAGGMAGLAVDAMTGGLSLGAAAALGAALGALVSGSRTHGKRLADRLRGFTELRVNDATLRLLALRQIELIRALLRRGHASQDKIRVNAKTADADQQWKGWRLPDVVKQARANPDWSRLQEAPTGQTGGRLAAMDRLARLLEAGFADTTPHQPNPT
jgi:small GTP-binding protein